MSSAIMSKVWNLFGMDPADEEDYEEDDVYNTLSLIYEYDDLDFNDVDKKGRNIDKFLIDFLDFLNLQL